MKIVLREKITFLEINLQSNFTGSLLGTTNVATTYLAKRSDKQFNNTKYYQIEIQF